MSNPQPFLNCFITRFILIILPVFWLCSTLLFYGYCFSFLLILLFSLTSLFFTPHSSFFPFIFLYSFLLILHSFLISLFFPLRSSFLSFLYVNLDYHFSTIIFGRSGAKRAMFLRFLFLFATWKSHLLWASYSAISWRNPNRDAFTP